MSLAVNDPKSIEEALKPSIQETVKKASDNPEEWDSGWLEELQ